ncbi:MAG: ion transporter [Bacteroidales bacterium]
MKERNKIETLRHDMYEVIFGTDTPAGKLFDIILLWFILLSVLLATIESLFPYTSRYSPYFRLAEWIITGAFTVEYLCRIFSSPKPKKYIFSFFGVIDLLAILPSYISLIFAGTYYIIVIRSLRLLRVFRILKLTRFMDEGTNIIDSIKRSLKKIILFSYFIIILAVILGSLMYMVESGTNHSFSNIPKSIYWAIVTITTVGYGDITPITYLGQLIAVIVMLLGYAIIAVPAGIVSGEVVKSYKEHSKKVCSKCGNTDNDSKAAYCKSCGTQLRREQTTEK